MFGFFEGWQENPISRNYVLLSGTHEPTKEHSQLIADVKTKLTNMGIRSFVDLEATPRVAEQIGLAGARAIVTFCSTEYGKMDSGYEELQFSLKNSECAHIPVKLSQKTDVDHSDQRTQTSAWDIANHIQVSLSKEDLLAVQLPPPHVGGGEGDLVVQM
ncbi:unnamed protein product [Durusdinium trenchii]|uniref:TIR domain-containing protein n=1 Tax=Durusdinium trenchii TaxID=1381693 RepID=A0ABP0INK9_9DINO